GCSRGNASRAASAESASAIRYFASSARRNPYRAAGSSSTISIVFVMSVFPYFLTSLLLCFLQWQRHFEPCPMSILYCALPIDSPTEFRHAPRHNRQAQAGSLRFRGEERLKNLLAEPCRNSRSVVFHEYAAKFAFTLSAHCYLASGRRGFQRIYHQVRHDVIQ